MSIGIDIRPTNCFSIGHVPSQSVFDLIICVPNYALVLGHKYGFTLKTQFYLTVHTPKTSSGSFEPFHSAYSGALGMRLSRDCLPLPRGHVT